MADFTRDVNVGEKIHFDLNDPIPVTSFTTAPLNVEAKAPLGIAPHLGGVGLGKEVADVIKDPGIGRRVRARRPADRGLINIDDLFNIFNAADRLVASRFGRIMIQLLG